MGHLGVAERVHELGRTSIAQFESPFDLQAVTRWAMVLEEDLPTVRSLWYLSDSVQLGGVALVQVPVRQTISDVSALVLSHGLRLCEPLCAVILLAQKPALLRQRQARTLVAPFRGADNKLMACCITEFGSRRQVCVDESESLVTTSEVVIARC